jgi:cytochrome c biogenesis protein CcdA
MNMQAGNRPREQTSPIWYWLLGLGVLLLGLAGYLGYVLYPRFGLPAIDGAALLILATGAGVASFFSPCSFPLLVTFLARQTRIENRALLADRSKTGIVIFASALSIGAAVFLLLVGIVIALGGESLFASITFTSPAGRLIRMIVGSLLILLGLMQTGKLPLSLYSVVSFSRPLLRLPSHLQQRSPLLATALFGFTYLLAGFG